MTITSQSLKIIGFIKEENVCKELMNYTLDFCFRDIHLRIFLRGTRTRIKDYLQNNKYLNSRIIVSTSGNLTEKS